MTRFTKFYIIWLNNMLGFERMHNTLTYLIGLLRRVARIFATLCMRHMISTQKKIQYDPIMTLQR